LVFVLAAGLVGSLTGCSAAPRQRPVKMGPVDTGSGSLESVRRQLSGTWQLVSIEGIDASGKATPRKASGTLTYDEYSNLNVTGKLEDTGVAQTSVSGLLSYSGRAVIDVDKGRLVLMDVKSRLQNGEPLPENVSPDKVRYYAFEGDLLNLTVKDASGATTARTTWRKVR
jgi:hypothetical protein